MRHTPRSRDLSKAAVSLGTGTATLAAFAATGALAGAMVKPTGATNTASTTPPSASTSPVTTDSLLTQQQLADQLAAQIKDRQTTLRKLNRLITRAKKTAKRLNVSTRTTSSGSTSTSTTTKSAPAPKPAPAPAPSSGS